MIIRLKVTVSTSNQYFVHRKPKLLPHTFREEMKSLNSAPDRTFEIMLFDGYFFPNLFHALTQFNTFMFKEKKPMFRALAHIYDLQHSFSAFAKYSHTD